MRIKSKKGFTLIELLITIAIVGIISVVAFVALDPATRLKDSRDAKRWTDVSAVLDAVKIDQVDNRGSYLAEIEDNMTAGIDYMIGTAASGCEATPCDVTIGPTNCADLTGLATEGYLASVPVSADGDGTWDSTLTGYYINKSTTGAITVGACESENTAAISVSR
jgi:prepilin-type N-terminal cleavage/methylation domain-containing protein